MTRACGRAAWLVLLAAAACGGPASGNTSPDAAPASADAAPTTIILGSLSDTCDGMATLTGQQVVSQLVPSYAATYAPIGGGAASALTIGITYNGGTITCHPHRTGTGGAPDVAAHLDLAVNATFATGDGTFDEAFGATVTLFANAASPGLALAGTVPVSDLQGTYTPQIAGTWMNHDVSFGGEVAPPAGGSGSAGTTSGTAEEQANNMGMGEVTGAGTWK